LKAPHEGTTTAPRQYTLRRRRGTICAAVVVLATSSPFRSNILGGCHESPLSSSPSWSGVSAFSTPSPKVSLTTRRSAHPREASPSFASSRSSSASNGLLVSSSLDKGVSRTGSPRGVPPGSPLEMLCTDKHEFELQVGRAMDTLRDDYPYILTKNPSKHVRRMMELFN
jgi:hypothetical protein